MVLTASIVWLVLACLLVIAELFTGTIFILMLAISAVVGSILAWLGLPVAWQMIGSGVVGLILVTMVWQKRRQLEYRQPDVAMNLDVGQMVTVGEWRVDEPTKVHYRGSWWEVDAQAGQPKVNHQVYQIAAVRGNVLLLKIHE